MWRGGEEAKREKAPSFYPPPHHSPNKKQPAQPHSTMSLAKAVAVVLSLSNSSLQRVGLQLRYMTTEQEQERDYTNTEEHSRPA
jgi:hypothetical protein